MKIKLLFLALLVPYVALTAQPVITNSQMIGVGSTRVLDTYLSAEHFSGIGFSFLSHTERQKRLSTIIEHEANFSTVKDRSRNKHELEGAYNFYWGKLYNWQLMDNRLRLQARAHLNLMPTGVASYRFTLFKKTAIARYELSLPLLGVQFSPNYGQSYYEIFSRGNYDHNIVPTTFVNAPEWRQMLTLDTQLSQKLTLRIGYLGNIQQSRVNGLRQHIYTHRFLIGFTRCFTITPHAL